MDKGLKDFSLPLLLKKATFTSLLVPKIYDIAYEWSLKTSNFPIETVEPVYISWVVITA